MKQNIRFWGFYCLRRTSPDFLRTFFSLSLGIYYEFITAYIARTYQNLSQNSDTGYPWLRRWQNKGRKKAGVGMLSLRKARPTPCLSPPSLTLPSGPIPICPAYTSVKNPKSGTLAKGKRLHSGRMVYTERSGIADGSDRAATGVCFGSASELNANSEPPRFALDRLRPNQGTTKSKRRPNQGTTKLRSHLQECPERGLTVARPSTAWDWFDYGNTRVRLLLGCASAFSRSIVEGFPKPSRTLVEALSKDCRTSPEQQSNTCRRNPEESCVWTHAKAPARSGLGLALGMLLLCLFAFHTGVCALTTAKQTTGSDRITPLQIGDTIPDAFWNMPLQVVNHPDGRDVITLADYKGKLIILDFWATWCTSCIKAIERNEPIGREFKDKLQFLPVTSQDKALLSRFFDNKELFLSVHGDTLLSRLFPHKLIPHCVWIATNGEVLAITPSSAVTRSSIQNALQNSTLDFQKKEDLDLSRPLFLAGLPTTGAGLNRFEIIVQGSVSGLPSSSWSGIYQDSLRRLLLTNVSVKKAVRILMRLMLSGYDDKKLIYSNGAGEMEDSLQTVLSYDLITAAASGNLYSQALRRINELGPLTYRIMERPMECIVISTPEGHAFVPAEKANDTVTTKRLINRLNALNPADPLVIDETGKQYLPGMDIDSITSLRSALGLIRNQYGLDVRREQRNVEICLISIK